MEKETKTYGTGFIITNVNPPTEIASVMNFLITGHPLAGHSMDGVTWELSIEESTRSKRVTDIEKAMKIGLPPLKEE
jgi:hypothetical protein